MKEDHVMTPSSELDPKKILIEQNAEIRRELIRKIGIERLMSACKHELLERVGDYELLSVQLSDEIPDARYLKMINPSIKTFHVEGVDPSCSTVEQALNWRNQNWFTHAEVLT